ncbi:uncharacterized protein LOC143358814 [Halictus rubicundus]|uniref:uncharacterized protein LOC143358814 n=1 Tax=Halictus rubicundus TaxID=77578 RepID=UPI00403595A4
MYEIVLIVNSVTPWTVNVWCGILCSKIVGPYFIQGTLTGIKYAAFLRQDLSGLLEEITLFDRERMWFQHDGCPAHYSKVAGTVLNMKYPGRWIGDEDQFHGQPVLRI